MLISIPLGLADTVMAASSFLDCRQRSVCVYMARAGTIPEFTHRIPHVRVFMFLVRIAPVIILVATCAIRFIGRELPRNGFVIAGVAGDAAQVARMISGIIARGMRVPDRSP